MTLAQLAALVDAENAMHSPKASGPERGTGADLVALAGMAG